MSVKTLKRCINTFELPFGPPHPTLESPALFTLLWQLWGRGSHTPSLSRERRWAGGDPTNPPPWCGLLGEAPGHLSAPLFGPWSLRLGRAAGEGLGSAGCPLPLQRQTGQRGARSAGKVGMVRAEWGGGASCFIVTDPALFPEILPSSKKRKEKPREPLGLPGKGRANGNQGSHRSHGQAGALGPLAWAKGQSALRQSLGPSQRCQKN